MLDTYIVGFALGLQMAAAEGNTKLTNALIVALTVAIIMRVIWGANPKGLLASLAERRRRRKGWQ